MPFRNLQDALENINAVTEGATLEPHRVKELHLMLHFIVHRSSPRLPQGLPGGQSAQGTVPFVLCDVHLLNHIPQVKSGKKSGVQLGVADHR